VNHYSEIAHPAVRSILGRQSIEYGLEIHHDGDLPARSGLGSSSSFVVGLIHALGALQRRALTKKELAMDAINVEQKVMGESVGSQDQVSAAYGGFNKIRFNMDESISVDPVILSVEKLHLLESSVMLFYTGISRFASEVAKEKIDNLNDRELELKRLFEMVDEGIKILIDSASPIENFGRLLDEGWQYKKALSSQVTSPLIDQAYDAALGAGAHGGKILGAGGGGFLMFIVPQNAQAKVREALKNMVCVPIKFDYSGSQVVVFEPDGF
jgi:D-glycero-alpha-D-manno-heptose-7-phosphate kinase